MRRMEEARRAVALGAAVVMSLVPAAALAQVQSAPPAYPVPQAAPVPEEAPPPETQWTVPQESGRWVYTVDHGWVFVPNGASPVVMDGVPYVWLYTPAVGWSWYVSPWGNGGYRYGAWVRHPWHPRNAPRVWVAPQHVHARLGRPGYAPAPRHEQPRHEQPRRR